MENKVVKEAQQTDDSRSRLTCAMHKTAELLGKEHFRTHLVCMMHETAES